jgi:nitroreductase
MEFDECVRQRRATRSLEKTEISGDMIQALGEAARLSPSCFNNQPWQYHFVFEPEPLARAIQTLSAGNQAWAKDASLIIAVLSHRDADCKIPDGRDYYQFDSGMSTAFILLKATELGLVAHPIAGYDPAKYKETFSIPDPLEVLALIVVGKKAKAINPALKDYQVTGEKERPARKEVREFAFLNEHWSMG